MTGSDIRYFFRELFGSRVSETLQEQLLRSYGLLEQQRQNFEAQIADLRQEKSILNARISMYEAKNGLREPGSIPPKPTFGVDFSKMPPMKTKWQIEVEKNDERNARELAEEEAAKNRAATAA